MYRSNMEGSSEISHSEAQRYNDLGLGRGVNVTDSQMWRNKSPFLIRRVNHNLSNIIGTEESGLKEQYEKEVSTVATQQLKIKLSLNEPSSQVRIGVDEQNSQSTSSTRMVAGTKVKTRTISFRTDFNDLPLYASVGVEMPVHAGYPDDSKESFEISLCSWILERIRDRQSRSSTLQYFPGKVEELTGDNSSSKLANYLRQMSKSESELEAVANDCKVFVQDLGITHYVSVVELGALKYSVLTISSHQEKIGAGAQLGAGKMAEGGIAGGLKKLLFKTTEEEKEIGMIGEDGTVRRNTTNEAVIEFQIQPIHRLIGLQYIRLAMEVAIREYIRIKANNGEGPFLISGNINGKPVYWAVDEDHQVIGTESLEEASPFYIIPTGDVYHPSDFLIAYYGKEDLESDLKRVTTIYDQLAELCEKAPPLPFYLTSNSNIFGSSDDPLKLHSTVLVQEARFSLHSRVQSSFTFMMCLSTPVSVSSWIEGEKFYINCSHRSFKIDGYIAMKKETDSTYKTVTVPTMKDPRKSTDSGMLFRLHLPKCKKRLTNLAAGGPMPLSPTEPRRPTILLSTEPRRPTPPSPTEPRRPTPPSPTEPRRPMPPPPTEPRRPTPPSPAERRRPMPPSPTEPRRPTPPSPTERRRPMPPSPTEPRRPTPPPPTEPRRPTPPPPTETRRPMPPPPTEPRTPTPPPPTERRRPKPSSPTKDIPLYSMVGPSPPQRHRSPPPLWLRWST